MFYALPLVKPKGKDRNLNKPIKKTNFFEKGSRINWQSIEFEISLVHDFQSRNRLCKTVYYLLC